MIKNKRAKGRRNELKCKQLLEDRDYEVEVVKGSTMWNKQCDFFGLFDVIAFKNNSFKILCIQVKTNRKPLKKDLEAMEKFYERHYNSTLNIHIWVFKDREKFPIVYEYIHSSGWARKGLVMLNTGEEKNEK